jgi:cation:H+ antiporter
VAPDGLPVSAAVLWFDLPVMIAVSVACLPVFFTWGTISRGEGAVFLGYYGAYAAYLVLAATHHDALSTLSTVMGLFVLPLTGLTLVVVTVQAWRRRRAEAS